MIKQKPYPIVCLVYQAVLIVAAGLIVILGGKAWRDLLLSQNLAVLGVLFLSAVAVEARPVRLTAIQNTTLAPTVLLLALMLTREPILVVAVSGVGAFVGYGLLRELPAHVRQMPVRMIQRIIFYTAQSIVAATIAGGLHSLLPPSISADLVLNVVTGFGLVVVYILFSKGFVSVYNRFVSFRWPGDAPLPNPSFLLFSLTAVTPLITLWVYQIVPEGSYLLVELLGQEGVKSFVLLCVWPIILLFLYVASPYLTIGLESEEVEKDYAQFSRYSEKMLDMAGITELVTKDMKAEFGCHDCIVYSWNDKERTYELEGGLLEDRSAFRKSAEAIPDIDWPKMVEPAKDILGIEVERGKLGFFQGKDARSFLESVSSPCSQCTSVLIIPLRYMREGTPDVVRVGFVILVKRGGIFSRSDRVRAADRMNRRRAVHTGLRQARLYRDAQEFFVGVNKAVSRSGEVLAATQALFSQGIDPAKFMAGIGRGFQTHALQGVVKSIAQGRSPGGAGDILGGEGIKRIYARIRQDNPSLPKMTPEIEEDIRTVVSLLSAPFSITYAWPTPEYGGITREMRELYSLFSSALEANTIDGIFAFGTKLNDQENLDRLAGDFPEVVKQLSSLRQVIRTLKPSQDSTLDSETRVDHLSEALRMLDRANGKVPGSTERLILAQIRSAWATVIYNRREELLGRSDLTMQLETQTAILTAEGIVVDLRVGNQGKSAATDIALRIAASDEYDILDPVEAGGHSVEMLGPGQSHQFSFQIRPRREDFVRVAFKAVWSDRLRGGRTMSYAGRVILQPETQVFVPIENPYIPGPPLRAGNRLFMGREDVFDFVRNSIGTGGQHNVLILTGQRRTGKTSLALQMPETLERDRYVVAYVDGQALGIEPGVNLLLRDLGLMICDGLEDYGIECKPLSLEGSGRSATERFEREFLSGVFSAIGERSLVLVLDEFEELENRIEQNKLDATIFQFIRHLMQHIPNLAFVFVGSHRLQELTRDYWSIFFDLALHRQIGFLDEEAARRLITEPTEQDIFDPYAVHEIIRLTAGHPYFVQLLCHYMVDFRNRSHLQTITVQHVRDAIRDILVQAEGHLTHLWRTAPPLYQLVMASASRVLARQDSVQASDVVEQLAAYRVDQDPQQVLSAAEALAGQEIFERLEGDPPRYRFRVELIRRWIERNQPLSLVVGSLP